MGRLKARARPGRAAASSAVERDIRKPRYEGQTTAD
jgi:hypothetical protein